MRIRLYVILVATLALVLAGCEKLADGETSASRQASPTPTAASVPSPSTIPTPAFLPYPSSPMPTVSAAPGSTGYSMTFYATGPSVNPPTVYAVWIEDENGTNMQNLYVCNREAKYVGPTPSPFLTGDALPNWKTKKHPQHADIDGITGPSTQEVICFARGIDFDTASNSRFRVCMEIDRSNNSNAYFSNDRPAFTYKTALIDIASPQSAYSIFLAGWMSNNTTGGYGQQPNTPIPSYAPYVFMEDTTYVYPYDDMVTAGQVVISHN
jgi:hypothetical protein